MKDKQPDSFVDISYVNEQMISELVFPNTWGNIAPGIDGKLLTVPNFYGTALFVHARKTTFPLHYHKEAEWVHVLQGEMDIVKYSTSGTILVDKTIKSGDSVFCGSNEPHFVNIENDCFYIVHWTPPLRTKPLAEKIFELDDQDFELFLKKAVDNTQMFRLFFEESDFLHCVIDSDGHFVYVNNAWVNTLKYTREELAQKPFWEFMHPDDIDYSKKLFQGIEINKQKFFTNRYKVKTGGYARIKWASSSVTYNDKFLSSAIFDGYE